MNLPTILQSSPWSEFPASWITAMKISPSMRQATWWVWHLQCRTWWDAGKRQPAAKVPARKMALIISPTGYKVNLMSGAMAADLQHRRMKNDVNKGRNYKLPGDYIYRKNLLYEKLMRKKRIDKSFFFLTRCLEMTTMMETLRRESNFSKVISVVISWF